MGVITNAISLQDALLRKAANFVFVISEKELDLEAQQVCKSMTKHVLSACKAQNNEEFELYKNKIVVLYEALSYKKYDKKILEA